jgi:alpha-mannosidase
MIRKWNEKYEWPQLRLSVISDFFEEIEELHADDLPVYRTAWPDWWVDGFGSGAREMGATRQAHMDIIAGQSLLSMARLLGHELPEHSDQQMALSNDALLFYGEHTFGSHASVREPYGKGTKEMRRLKESFAWEASRRTKLVQEDAFGLIQSHVSNLKETSVVIYNTTPQKRTGISRIFIDHETVPRGTHIQLRDENGNVHTAQLLENIHGGSYWALRVEDIPSYGFRQFVVEHVDDDVNRDFQTTNREVFENDWYRLEIDTERGVVAGLYDKELQKELVDENAEWGFGQFIYERLGNRVELDQYYLESYDRYPLETVRFDGVQRGDIWDTIRFTGSTKAAIGDDGFSLEIKMHHADKQIDFTYNIRKKPIVDPEGVYIAFPFKLDGGDIFFDVPGGMIQAGVDQIPGSSNDWNMVQNVALVRNDEVQINLSSHEAPLMQMGNINTGRFEAGAGPENPHIYGWPMNNYWVTNFNADQKGEFEWTYNITSGKQTENSAAMTFAWNNRLPLLPRMLPGASDGEQDPARMSLLSEFPKNVHVVNISPKEENSSILLHLRETDGEEVQFTPQFSAIQQFSMIETDVNGNRLDDRRSSNINLRPYEAKFIEVILE